MNNDLRAYTHLVGLVPQDDTMHRWLTVEENLWIYAYLRQRKPRPSPPSSPLPSSSSSPWCCAGGSGGRSEEQKRSEERRLGKKVANIMHVLGLWKHRKTIIGDERRRGISGGQRKRVNVAMELVMDPSVLFLE